MGGVNYGVIIMGVYIIVKDSLVVQCMPEVELEKTSVKLSAGCIVKKHQRLKARNSPLNAVDRTTGFLDAGFIFLALVDLLLDALIRAMLN